MPGGRCLFELLYYVSQMRKMFLLRPLLHESYILFQDNIINYILLGYIMPVLKGTIRQFSVWCTSLLRLECLFHHVIGTSVFDHFRCKFFCFYKPARWIIDLLSHVVFYYRIHILVSSHWQVDVMFFSVRSNAMAGTFINS